MQEVGFMYLTKDEERIYDGEYGWAKQVSIRILVKLGDLYGADRLIPIESAHISGVAYRTIGDASIEFLKELANSNAKAAVRATTNPSSIDTMNQLFSCLPRNVIEKQREIINLYETMGIEITLTCTPYYIRRPAFGSHLSWAESSAVIYANSLLNAWTNREGGPSALASALVGKTPNYGLHKPENRRASVLVKVEAPLKSEADYGVLGMYLGEVLGNRIPVISGLRRRDEMCLKQLGAAMATSGMASMFYLDENYVGERSFEEEISVDDKSLKASYERLSSTIEKPDLVLIGCPHSSPEELKIIARYLEGKRVRDDVKLWVCVSKYVRRNADEYVRVIETSGGHVICDTCAVVTWLRELGVETLVSNSAKTVHYAPLLSKVGASLSSLEECVKIACGK
ncbi:MAG: aconitase X catalytic domain-containing protein [Candidatus Bathyarchaeia archaeon]